MTSAGHRQLLKDFLENDPDSHLNVANNQKPRISKLSISRTSKAATKAVSVIHRAFNSTKSFSKVYRITCRDISVEVSVVRSSKDLVENGSSLSDSYDPEMQCSGTFSLEEDELSRKDEEQGSPVSILNFHFQEVGKHEFLSHQYCLATTERRKNMLMHNSQDFEYLPRLESIQADNNEKVYIEKKHHEEDGFEAETHATKHLNHEEIDEIVLNSFCFDFFHDELTTSANEDIFESNLRKERAWINGEYEGESELEVKGKKMSCVREMDKGGKWSKFEEEKEELAFEVEAGVLDCLIDELLIDLFEENV